MADTKISDLTTADALTGAAALAKCCGQKLALSTLKTYAQPWQRPSDWPAMPASLGRRLPRWRPDDGCAPGLEHFKLKGN